MTERITFEPTLICSVAFLTWISSFEIFGTTIRRTLGWLMGEIQSIPHVDRLEQALTEQGLGIEQQVVLALKMYGDNLICLSLTAITLLIIARGFVRRRDEMRNLSILSMPFLVSGPVWVLIFATTLRVTVGRLLGSNAMMWAAPVLAAFALYEVFGKWKTAGIPVVTTILLFTSVVAIFGVYHSPYILGPSWQVTRQDHQGTAWFWAHNPSPTTGYFASLGVPATLAGGVIQVQDHFGYPSQARLGQSYSRDVLLLLGERFRLSSMHPTLSQAMISPRSLARRGFTESDFMQVQRDPSVDKLYSNGELDVLLIRGEM